MSVPQEQVQKQTQELAVLGDGKVFVKRTDSGMVKAVKAQMKLEEKKGHLAEVSGKVMITAGGYNELNKIAGISIITPDKLTLPDGSVVVNPYPIIDPESGTISKVWVKKMAIGLSPIGNLTITSSTLLYDIQMYFIQDLVKKVQYNSAAGRMCLKSMLTDTEKQKGVFYQIEGDLGVWADFSNKEVLKAIETFVQNKLFAERKAQTIAERNVMKKHPALSMVYVDAQGPEKGKTAMVPVIGFTHDFSKEELLDIAQKAADGEPLTLNNKRVEIIENTEVATEEDAVAGTEVEEGAQDSLFSGGSLL
ncbi:hypothetical protein JCM15765_15020 [Paradesulfitobacterium aromaticivorans]